VLLGANKRHLASLGQLLRPVDGQFLNGGLVKLARRRERSVEGALADHNRDAATLGSGLNDCFLGEARCHICRDALAQQRREQRLLEPGVCWLLGHHSLNVRRHRNWIAAPLCVNRLLTAEVRRA
jgi:hypothetical protein